MRLKLKEKPSEWVKFTAVMTVLAAVLTFLLHRRGYLPQSGLLAVWATLLFALVVCAFRPRLCRGFYRSGMTMTFHIGQVVASVLLVVLFLVVLTPLGLILRLLGKDLLAMRRRRDANTYWREAQKWGPLDRMF